MRGQKINGAAEIARRLKSYIRRHRGTLFDVLLISVVSLLPLTWFTGNLLINANEFNFSLSPTVNRFFYTWASYQPPGNEATRNIAEIIFRGAIALLSGWGLSLVTVEKMFFVLVFMGSGLSMYYLVSTLIQGEKRRLAALTAALFWMINPFVMNYLWHTLFMPLELYALFPLILALFINGLRKKKGFPHIFLLSIISAILLSHSGVNTVEIGAYVMMLLLYLILYIVEKRKNRAEIIGALKFCGLLTVVWVAFNLWWLLPQLSALPRELSSSLSATEGVGVTVRGTLETESSRASFLSAASLKGPWAFDLSFKGDPFYSYANSYSSLVFQLIGLLIPLLAFFSLMRRQKDIHLLYFSLLALVGIFLTIGMQPPFGRAFLWLFENVPLFGVFRHFQLRFTPFVVLSYAFLIGVAVSQIYIYIKTLRRPNISRWAREVTAGIPVLIIFIFLFGIHAYPMWTGEVILEKGEIAPSARIEVPNYYQEANDWLNGQKEDFAVLGLPYSKLFYAVYDWEHGYGGVDPSMWLFSKPIYSGYQGVGWKLPLMAGELLSGLSSEFQTDEAGKLLALLNVKYILVHRDTQWKRVEGDPWWVPATLGSIQNNLKKQKGIWLEKSFGKLDFYRNNYWRPMHVYATNNIVSVDGNLKAMDSWASVGDFNDEVALFLFADLSQGQKDFIQDKAKGFFSHKAGSTISYVPKVATAETTTLDFETGDLSTLSISFTEGDSAMVTDKDSYSGAYSLELALSGKASRVSVYRDFGYDGKGPININAWMKVVSQTTPAGAFIYLRGYDADDLERVRIMYHAYDNWDTPTGAPGSCPECGAYSHYSLKVDLEKPLYDAWINVNQNPRDEFEARFPGVWEKLGLTKIRLDLNSWGDGKITSRYDKVKISGVYTPTLYGEIIQAFSVPKAVMYELFASIGSDFKEPMQYKIDDGEPKAFTPEILDAGQYFNLVKIGESWLTEGKHVVQFIFEKGGAYQETDFESGDFGGWVTKVSQGSSAEVTNSDSHSGEYSAELALSGFASEVHVYKDYFYDGKSPMKIDAWMKVVSRTPPGGAFLYLRGYDAEDVERARLIYFLEDNWDSEGTPKEHGQGPFYALKYGAWNHVPNGTWIQVERKPRDEFEARFPSVWETLQLTKFRLELFAWGDKEVTALYDDVKISGVLYNPINYVSAFPQQKETYYVPQISFQRINPTKVLVRVNATQPFLLILSESYHPLWKAYYGKASWIEAFFKKPLSADSHFKVNGYANAWYIDKVGDYDITLYFQTQSWFYIGAIISGLSFAGSIGYLGWRRRRGNKFSIRE